MTFCMANKRQSQLENDFIIEISATMSDEEAVRAFREEFGRPITVAALTKRRQRMGLKKEGWRNYSKLLEEEDELG